jgi:hypothetical protein
VDDLLNVVAAWWDGRQTTDMEVFGWKMLYYGRAGKIMLLVAGLAVIFDLLKPETVIRWGAASQERAKRALSRGRHNREAVRLAALHEAVVAAAMTRTAIHARGKAIVRYDIREEAPEQVPEGLGVTLDAYRRFHRDLIDELSAQDTDENRYAHVRRRADALLADHLPGDDRGALATARRAADDVGCLWLGLVILLGGVGYVFASVRTADPAVPLLVLVVTTGLFVVTAFPAPRLLAVSLLWRLAGRIARSLAATLRRTRPFHVFRWAAFALFFVGSLVDLLAS